MRAFGQELGKRSAAGAFVCAKEGGKPQQIAVEARQRTCVETCEGFGQYAGKRARCSAQDGPPCGESFKMDGAPVGARSGRADQIPLHERLDKIARGGLVDVHRHRQVVNADPGTFLNYAQRPKLRATDSRRLLNLLKVCLDGVKDMSKPPQNAGGFIAKVARLWGLSLPSRRPLCRSSALLRCHLKMISETN